MHLSRSRPRLFGGPIGKLHVVLFEYSEGSSNNKYLEIFNPGLTEVSLATMALAHTVNAPATPGTYETWVEFHKFDGSCRQCIPSRTPPLPRNC